MKSRWLVAPTCALLSSIALSSACGGDVQLGSHSFAEAGMASSETMMMAGMEAPVSAAGTSATGEGPPMETVAEGGQAPLTDAFTEPAAGGAEAAPDMPTDATPVEEPPPESTATNADAAGGSAAGGDMVVSDGQAGAPAEPDPPATGGAPPENAGGDMPTAGATTEMPPAEMPPTEPGAGGMPAL